MEQRPSGVTIDFGRVASKGIVLLFIGFVLILVGFGMISMGSFNDLFTGQPMFPGLYSFGLVAFGLGVALIVVGVVVKLREKPLPQTLPLTGGPRSSEVVKETTIVKEVVMIPCRYCGTLMPQTSTFCPNCGARREA
jgi:hypothetical protein